VIALSIALGVCGLAAVLAARDVVLRWLASKERMTRSHDIEALAAVVEQNRSELAAAVAELATKAEEAADEARKLRLARMGR
jgi:hypothetical protein